jgi:hypothetical protein
VLARHEFPAATTGVVFPGGAAVHDGQSLIVWWSADTDTIVRLHATESSTGADAVLARGGVIHSVKVLPRDNAWLLYFAELDGESNTSVNRSLVRNAAFGEVEPLFCARGSVDYTLRGERIGAVAYSAPDPALEGASRLYFRRSIPPRRRASR